MNSIILRTILLASTLPFSMPSHSDLEEIIVTGLKRAQDRDQVMSSVSVLNEITIKERVIDSFEDVVNLHNSGYVVLDLAIHKDLNNQLPSIKMVFLWEGLSFFERLFMT
jgi:rRNA maturation protein Rpf1